MGPGCTVIAHHAGIPETSQVCANPARPVRRPTLLSRRHDCQPARFAPQHQIRVCPQPRCSTSTNHTIEALSWRSVMIWNNNSAPRGSRLAKPTSSSYADIRIAGSMPRPRLCRGSRLRDGYWRSGAGFAHPVSLERLGIVAGFRGTRGSCHWGGSGPVWLMSVL